MTSFILGLIAAFIFLLRFFGVEIGGRDIGYLGLFFTALAIAFYVLPWSRKRVL